MRLTDLQPRLLHSGGDGVARVDTGQPVPRREGVGMTLLCPCGCGMRFALLFENPLDGGPGLEDGGARWRRTGDTFETMTLNPSVLRSEPRGCGWHGWVIDGEVRPC